MSKKKPYKKADGIWVSDERRITDECKQVYPTIYAMYRTVLVIACAAILLAIMGPTLLNHTIASYAVWGNTFETVTLIVAVVMIVAYGFANYFWQKKMERFRTKYEVEKYKKQQEAAKRKRAAKGK